MDTNLMCATDAQRLEQAKRLIPYLEAEIASGETRPMFQQLLDAQYRVLERLAGNCCQGRCEFHGQLWCKTNNRPCSEYCDANLVPLGPLGVPIPEPRNHWELIGEDFTPIARQEIQADWTED